MALVNYATREINAKVVYYGPGLSGKTTNIHHVFGKVKPENKGKLISLSTQGDRTLFFDFLPVELGEIKGFRTRFHLYTVPGQVFYNSTRKLVLKGADGVVFVADSQKMMMDENLQSLDNLKANLAEMGIRPDRFPVILQYNKRDLPDAATVEDLQGCLNPTGLPYFEATAVTGEGVLPTLTAIVKYILHDLSRDPAAHNLRADALSEGGDTAAADAALSPEPVEQQAQEPEATAEAAPGPEPETKAAPELPATGTPARQTFVLPIKLNTGDGQMELRLKISVEVEAKARPPEPGAPVRKKNKTMLQKSWA